MLKFALILAAIVSLVYGLGFLLIPNTLVKLSGGSLVEASWLRWPGGVLIAWAIGTLMVFGKPEKQNIFVTSLALAHLLSGLGLLYSWIVREYDGATWFIAIPTCLLLILSALLYWSRSQAKKVL
ncbi:MAG TPA: DUF4345 domain-containing protein [Caldithrix sp.]|nr:DUF4345 domain-containing protein [Caldithrix sp.]HER23835.1 DUF4345 domain-containing protein [Candidatus Atribacteria bacterium]